jgi:hypothetical protein
VTARVVTLVDGEVLVDGEHIGRLVDKEAGEQSFYARARKRGQR